MIHLYADGPEMIETARKRTRIIQIGSQRVSSVIYAKAKELLASGAIGQLNMVSAHWDRNSAMGAWNYTVPLDASPETCDGHAFWAPHPRFLLTPSISSSGASGKLMAAVWPAISLSISSAEPISSLVRMGLRVPWQLAGCASGKTDVMRWM